MPSSTGQPEWNAARIAGLLVRCGRYALAQWRAEDWRLKADGSLLTKVDEAVERELTAELENVGQGVHVIGEETVERRDEPYVARALAERAYVVDPIDGTAPFAHGIGYWGTSIGFMERGRLTHGGIIIPAQNELFVTDGERVLWTDRLDLAATSAPDLRELVPCFAPWNAGGMVALGQRLVQRHTFPWPNPTLVTGCAINALAYLLIGRLAAYLAHMKLWDFAAVLPMLLRCGGEARLVNGTPMTGVIDSQAVDLTPGSPSRWALRDECLFGPPAAFAEFYPAVCAHLHKER